MSSLAVVSDTASRFSIDSDIEGNPLRLLLFKVPKTIRAAALLKEGDKAQAATLRLLEKSEKYMDKHVHDDLRQKYDGLKTDRLKIKRGFLRQAKQWNKIAAYKDDSVDLHKTTVTLNGARHCGGRKQGPVE